MTFKELTELLVSRVGRWDDDLRVVVPTKNGGVPTMYMDPVTDANAGSDLTRPYLMLRTEHPLVLFRWFDKSLDEVARDKLDRVKSYHAELFKYPYIPKAREEAWMDGFQHGVKAFTLAAGAKLPDGDTVPVQRSLLEAIVQTGATEGQEGLRALLAQLGEVMNCQTNVVQERP